MYVGCSGATCVYTCCIIDKARICGNCFQIWDLQKGTSSLHREMEQGLMSKFA
jgi:hypothetical protein